MPVLNNLKRTGRPPGSKNKFGGDLKELLLGSLYEVGGRRWLVKLAQEEPGHYTKLLAAIIPRDVSHSGIITGVSVQINTNLSVGAPQQKMLEDGVIKGDLMERLAEASFDPS
jgi:hypothetical protein